jgi:hypothetical protein
MYFLIFLLRAVSLFKYSFQHPVLRHCWSVRNLSCERHIFTFTHTTCNYGKCVLVYRANTGHCVRTFLLYFSQSRLLVGPN